MSGAAHPAVRWTAYVGVAVLFAIACSFLSNWQFDRNAERSRQLALVADNYDADPVALTTLIPDGASLDPADEWRPVVLTGTYLSEDQLLARNRAHGGTAAYELLVPLRLDDGRVFLVDRGWEPPGNSQAEPDRLPAPPDSVVTVVARLKTGEALPASGRGAPEGQVPSINLPLIAGMLSPQDGDRLETSAYGWLVSEDPAPATAPNALEAPSADPGPYLSYAIQWILFAIMGFIFIAYVIRSERRLRREEAADAAAAAALAATDPDAAATLRIEASRRRSRASRRHDRDTSDEDAILDRAAR